MKNDDIILVTGGSRGIGKAIAIKLCNSGYQVVITYNHSKKEAMELEEQYKKIKAFKVDVTQRGEVRSMVDQIHDKLGSISGLVNNAGIWHLFPMEEFNEEKYDSIMDTNVKGPIYSILECLPDLKKNKGVIVNISSNAGIGTGAMNTTFYSISKAALIVLTKRLALEFEPYEIRVNAIAPGWVKTDLTIGGKSEQEIENLEKNFLSKTTVKRVGKPEDVAELAYYLLSDNSEFMNGQVLVIDGGRKDNLTHSV
jgi:3-oxoacyl-[acyl-carrier protein] reductase